MKLTQKQQVIQWLEEYGEVSRNQCLSHFISRLGAIIIVLKNEGYDFKPEHRGGDYVYKLTTAPVKPKKPIHKIDFINGEYRAVEVV